MLKQMILKNFTVFPEANLQFASGLNASPYTQLITAFLALEKFVYRKYNPEFFESPSRYFLSQVHHPIFARENRRASLNFE
jgi:hypothetical protein